MAEENQSGFKVTDRRLFNQDGTFRDEMASQQVVDSIPTTEPGYSINHTSSESAPEFSLMPDVPQDDPALIEEQAIFSEILMSFAQQAAFYLGLIPHPETGRPQVNLEAAKEFIGMLVTLQKKTKGNLTLEEERSLGEMLAELRMHFVSLNK